jgi:hypothetical protein
MFVFLFIFDLGMRGSYFCFLCLCVFQLFISIFFFLFYLFFFSFIKFLFLLHLKMMLTLILSIKEVVIKLNTIFLDQYRMSLPQPENLKTNYPKQPHINPTVSIVNHSYKSIYDSLLSLFSNRLFFWISFNLI